MRTEQTSGGIVSSALPYEPIAPSAEGQTNPPTPTMTPRTHARRSAPLKEPYSIEQYPTISGGVVLVGYDGSGRLKAEVRVEDVTDEDLDDLSVRIRNWIMSHDRQRGTRTIPPFMLIKGG